jgi:hypothetical protein
MTTTNLHPEIEAIDADGRVMFFRLREQLGLVSAAPCVFEALARARSRGFAGTIRSAVSLGDDRHKLHVVESIFACGGTSTYVVAADAHEGGGRPVLLPLSAVVHVLQNMTDVERWDLESREPRED